MLDRARTILPESHVELNATRISKGLLKDPVIATFHESSRCVIAASPAAWQGRHTVTDWSLPRVPLLVYSGTWLRRLFLSMLVCHPWSQSTFVLCPHPSTRWQTAYSLACNSRVA